MHAVALRLLPGPGVYRYAGLDEGCAEAIVSGTSARFGLH